MKYTLKTISVAVLFAGSSAALAGGMPQPTCAPALMDGFYLGAGVGATSEILRTTVSSTVTTVPAVKENYGMAGVDGTFYAGYSKNLSQQFNLAGEAFFQVRDLTTTFAGASAAASNDYKSQYAFGLAVMPGYNMNTNVRAYGRLGAIWSNNKWYPSTAAIALGGVNSKYTKDTLGWDLGAGLQAAVTEKLSVRAEYNYVNYRNWKLTNTANSNLGTTNTKFSNYENQFMASLQYSLGDLI